MKNYFYRSAVVIFIIASSLSLFPVSCRKKDAPAPARELSDADSLKYLMYRVLQKTVADGGRHQSSHLPLYYWYKLVPEINPLSGEFASADDLLNRIKSYAKGPDGRVMDRYSFLDDGTVMDEIEGNAGDIGIQATYARLSGDNILPVVLYTDKNSPAGTKGVTRGWIITSVNGQSTQYDGPSGPNLKRVVDALYNDEQATFGFITLDGGTVSIPLAKTRYSLNPMLFDTVFSVAGKNVGYFTFSTFADILDKNGNTTLTKNELDRVFASFASKGISSLIIDFRYNLGGSVRTAEFICNKITPSSMTGKLMHKTVLNDLLWKYYGLPKNEIGTEFRSAGEFNLENIFIISTRNTASASELVFNSLHPWVNIKLVGDTTNGKPIGFLPQEISITKNGQNKFLSYLLAATTETKNALDEGGYYFGINPDILAFDYVDIPWGDIRDDNLKKIFDFLTTGSTPRVMSFDQMRRDPSLPVAFPVRMPSLRSGGMVYGPGTNQFDKR